MFSRTSSFFIVFFLHMPAGILPVKEFVDMSTTSVSDQLPSVGGSSPVNRFKYSDKLTRSLKSPNSGGTSPENWFKNSWRETNLFMDRSSEMLPWSELLDKSK